eukprot:TRINITY_DN9981_c0_g1_i2.p1 TRINITY_DN9981_c0_g1~~TRINITY_DN9981_c0_g1_i2.p1  ORF type:complete len:426 (+),score=97.20 TRINITY_DN9981_c0_g1_i2:148-1278(+)
MGVAAGFATFALMYTLKGSSFLTIENTATWITNVLAFAPILFANIACSFTPSQRWIIAWIAEDPEKMWRRRLIFASCITATVSTCWGLSCIPNKSFSPSGLIVISSACLICIMSVEQAKKFPHPSRWGWPDLVVCVLLILLRNHWHIVWRGLDPQELDGLGRHWATLVCILLAIARFGIVGNLKHVTFKLEPIKWDAVVIPFITAGLILVVAPISIFLKVVKIDPVPLTALTITCRLVTTFFTAAIFDELIFRGMIQMMIQTQIEYVLKQQRLFNHMSNSTYIFENASINGIKLKNVASPSKWESAVGILVASLMFGVNNWRGSNWAAHFAYSGLSVISGIFLGIAYRWGNNRVFPAIVVHTIVDSARSLVFVPLL